jgi:hypothetical protein
MADHTRKLVPVTYSQCGHTDMVPQGPRPTRCSRGCDSLRPQHGRGWGKGRG